MDLHQLKFEHTVYRVFDIPPPIGIINYRVSDGTVLDLRYKLLIF